MTLPAALGVAGAPGVLATASGLVIGGGGDSRCTRSTRRPARRSGTRRCRARVNGTPMTYRSQGGRQFVVIATGGGENASLVAFALDRMYGEPTGRPAEAGRSDSDLRR